MKHSRGSVKQFSWQRIGILSRGLVNIFINSSGHAWNCVETFMLLTQASDFLSSWVCKKVYIKFILRGWLQRQQGTLYPYMRGLLHGWQVWIWISGPAGEKPWDKPRMKTHPRFTSSYPVRARVQTCYLPFSVACGLVSPTLTTQPQLVVNDQKPFLKSISLHVQIMANSCMYMWTPNSGYISLLVSILLSQNNVSWFIGCTGSRLLIHVLH